MFLTQTQVQTVGRGSRIETTSFGDISKSDQVNNEVGQGFFLLDKSEQSLGIPQIRIILKIIRFLGVGVYACDDA